MSRLTEIDGRIADLQAELERAQAEHAKCAVALAMNPTDSKAVQAARKTSATCKELQSDIDLLTDARDSLIEDRQTNVGKEKIEKAGELLKNARELLAKRSQAAADLDKALAALKDAVSNWVTVSGAAQFRTMEFFRTLYERDHAALIRYLPDTANVNGDCAANALAAQLDEALHGVKTGANIAFNYVRQRHDQQELVVSAADASASVMLDRMVMVANTEGVANDVH